MGLLENPFQYLYKQKEAQKPISTENTNDNHEEETFDPERIAFYKLL
jgi:hypothetical protein